MVDAWVVGGSRQKGGGMSGNFRPKPGAKQKFLQGPKVVNALKDQAFQIANRAGNGFDVRVSSERGPRARSRVVVLTTTAKAMAKNRKHNTLLRSLR